MKELTGYVYLSVCLYVCMYMSDFQVVVLVVISVS